VLFFGLVFPVASLEIFLPTPLVRQKQRIMVHAKEEASKMLFVFFKNLAK